jgi:hypothetical protein
MMRDLFRGDAVAPKLQQELYPEIAVIWGFFFSVFLQWEAERLQPREIFAGVVVTIVGAFLTRMLANELRVTSCELRVASYELRVGSGGRLVCQPVTSNPQLGTRHFSRRSTPETRLSPLIFGARSKIIRWE